MGTLNQVQISQDNERQGSCGSIPSTDSLAQITISSASIGSAYKKASACMFEQRAENNFTQLVLRGEVHWNFGHGAHWKRLS